MNANISITIDVELLKEVDRLSSKAGITRSAFIRLAVKKSVKSAEKKEGE